MKTFFFGCFFIKRLKYYVKYGIIYIRCRKVFCIIRLCKAESYKGGRITMKEYAKRNYSMKAEKVNNGTKIYNPLEMVLNALS